MNGFSDLRLCSVYRCASYFCEDAHLLVYRSFRSLSLLASCSRRLRFALDLKTLQFKSTSRGPLSVCVDTLSAYRCEALGKMQSVRDLTHGKVRINPDCGSLPRADEMWTASCESVEMSIARLQLPRRTPMRMVPRLDPFAGDAASTCTSIPPRGEGALSSYWSKSDTSKENDVNSYRS